MDKWRIENEKFKEAHGGAKEERRSKGKDKEKKEVKGEKTKGGKSKEKVEKSEKENKRSKSRDTKDAKEKEPLSLMAWICPEVDVYGLGDPECVGWVLARLRQTPRRPS